MRCPWKIQAAKGQRIWLSSALFGSAGTVDVGDNNKCLTKVVIRVSERNIIWSHFERVCWDNRRMFANTLQ